MRTIALLLTLILSTIVVQSGSYDKVKITPDISYVYIYHKGKALKVHRIQDTHHKLTGEYTKTYRPNTTIQPIDLGNGVKTVGEVELLKFMQEKVNKKNGLILDVRDKENYKKESIPTAVNIPAKLKDKPEVMENILVSLGMVKKSDQIWDGKKAISLMIYCDGLWCSKSKEMINFLVDIGYPSEKILYYRGGFQMWKILGFTTVKN